MKVFAVLKVRCSVDPHLTGRVGLEQGLATSLPKSTKLPSTFELSWDQAAR